MLPWMTIFWLILTYTALYLMLPSTLHKYIKSSDAYKNIAFSKDTKGEE